MPASVRHGSGLGSGGTVFCRRTGNAASSESEEMCQKLLRFSATAQSGGQTLSDVVSVCVDRGEMAAMRRSSMSIYS